MDERSRRSGQLTIPTDHDVIPETLELMQRWGADALRDCDGTSFPQELSETGAKVYATYYTTRKDNAWARANPEEVQQCYIMTPFICAPADGELQIRLLQGLSTELLEVNGRDCPARWWEVIDRSSGEVVPPEQWSYEEETGRVCIQGVQAGHEFSVSFLAYLIWDPVHMYNAVTNDWQDFEHQITFDVRQPKTRAHSMERLRQFVQDNPHVDVIRYTTFFHQFTLIFDELRREKYVDWYGYSASVSPYILERFEEEVGYPFRPEYIIDQGYYNNQYRIPSKEFKDFMAFQRREVAALAKEMVDLTHELGKEAMMFLGDHWIGTEPFMPEFQNIGLDAVVGSVGNAATLRLISDIPGLKYTEARFLPYFFPDVFHEGGDPVGEARRNWKEARRAILRKPVDRIGYGGYLKLACQFPDFIDYVERICDEYRDLYARIKGQKPYQTLRIGVLNAWGKMRSWGCHMVHHAIYHHSNYAYAGVFDILAGAAFDVQFFSFDELLADPQCIADCDVLLNVGDSDTAHSGGYYWEKPEISALIRDFVQKGGGFIGVGEPSGHAWQGRQLQLAAVLGVEKETGFTLGYDRYNKDCKDGHFILEDVTDALDFGPPKAGLYALEGAEILAQNSEGVNLVVNCFGQGRSVYLSGLPYTPQNARILYRALLWASGREELVQRYFVSNPLMEVHVYPDCAQLCVVNNAEEPAAGLLTIDEETRVNIALDAAGIAWYKLNGEKLD